MWSANCFLMSPKKNHTGVEHRLQSCKPARRFQSHGVQEPGKQQRTEAGREMHTGHHVRVEVTVKQRVHAPLTGTSRLAFFTFFKTSWKSGFLCEHSVEVLKTLIHKTHLWDKFCLGPQVPPLLLTFTSWYQALPSVRPEVYLLVSVPLLGQEETEVNPRDPVRNTLPDSYRNHEETAGKPKCRDVLQNPWPEEECKESRSWKPKELWSGPD